ncbi:MAG: SDR family oxidoreductase [Planctomycetales bacterium]|nr:SDR family oxidoreductase [Planctomycetales bacterium]
MSEIQSNQDFHGKIAIVTGGARGIGAACAEAMAAAGAHVIVNDINPPDEVLTSIRSRGGSATAALADVTDRAAVNELVSQVAKEFGSIDFLVTNAAFSDRELFYKANLAGFEKTIDVCMWGPFNFLHAVSNSMISSGRGGSIVCISSPHAFLAIPGAMAYNMAKAAVDQMARTAACELAQYRIRVNLIHPGWTDTPGERKFFGEEQLQREGSQLPWGRLARPDEIARGVVFLCDSGSEYITGTTLSIDGGILLPYQQMSLRIKD